MHRVVRGWPFSFFCFVVSVSLFLSFSPSLLLSLSPNRPSISSPRLYPQTSCRRRNRRGHRKPRRPCGRVRQASGLRTATSTYWRPSLPDVSALYHPPLRRVACPTWCQCGFGCGLDADSCLHSDGYDQLTGFRPRPRPPRRSACSRETTSTHRRPADRAVESPRPSSSKEPRRISPSLAVR